MADNNGILRKSVGIEIYNRDQALIREIRQIELDKGLNIIDFHSIADGIYGHTAHVQALDHQDRITPLSLGYHYDLIDNEKLISRFVGKWFTFSAGDLEYEGKLLKVDDYNLFMQPDTTDPSIEVVELSSLSEMIYSKIPEGLFTEPTLRWEVNSDKKLKKLDVEITYLTSDITWYCDYRAVLKSDSMLELSANYTIDNQLELSFPEANVAFVAGSTHRSSDPENSDPETIRHSGRKFGQTVSTGQKHFEYYRFPLDRTISLNRNQTIQIPFFSNDNVAYQKRYVFPHLLQNQQVNVVLEIDNNADSGLGQPLPEGDWGIYRRIENGSISFLGEDYLMATPVGHSVELNIGASFDVKARRTRVAQSRPERDKHEEKWQVVVTNSRNEETEVLVEQRVYGYYQVIDSNVDGKEIAYNKERADMLIFPVTVSANSVSILEYSILYGY
jgi:hypothetical protein